MQRNLKTTVMLLMSVAVLHMGMAAQAATPRRPDQQVQIVAKEMCCKSCARKVSGKLYAARGVKDVSVDMTTRTVTISLPKPSPQMLGKLWHAVEQGEGGPTRLVTPEATYIWARVEPIAAPSDTPRPVNSALHIVIDNLHCQGCAQKIAAQLYALKGVTKVSAIMQQETLIVQTRPDRPVSPWLAVEAVAKAKERPLAVKSPSGTLSIAWKTKLAPKTHQQAQQTSFGGIKR